MDTIELREAQLYRMLLAVFGAERVIPNAKISFVCGGALPSLSATLYPQYEEWAKTFRCLFTVLNGQDEPCMVVEFLSGFQDAIDPVEAQREHYLPSVLKCRNILYLTISDEDFEDLLAPDQKLSFLQLVEYKIGDEVLS